MVDEEKRREEEERVDDGVPASTLSRRSFLGRAAGAAGGALIAGSVKVPDASARMRPKAYGRITVDFRRCTGCRTCETACSAANHPTIVDGRQVKGLGDPRLSNIRVHHFNPDVDVPVTCALCPDSPCVKACPIPPDGKTGRKALYRDAATGTIRNDLARCVGCGACARACQTDRAGVIVPNPKTNKPERMCTLCDEDPQCVKACPYGALSLKSSRDEFTGIKPEAIARRLAARWFESGKGAK